MGARYWKGPWLPVREAAAYVGRSRRGFERMVSRCPTLVGARKPSGEGVGRPSWVYPVSALDAVMNSPEAWPSEEAVSA